MTGRLSVHIYLHNAAAECRLSSYGRLRGWRDKPGFSLSIEDDLVGRGAGLDGFGVLTAGLGRVGPTGTLRRYVGRAAGVDGRVDCVRDWLCD